MLALRPNCECCDKDLPAGAAEKLRGVCPNCGGELVAPPHPAASLARETSGIHSSHIQGGRLRGGESAALTTHYLDSPRQ